MKVLQCSCEYYSYPEGMENIEQFIDYVNNHYHSFIKLKKWKEDQCREPYFIDTEFEYRYVNVGQIAEIAEADITILSKDEYDRRLTQVVQQKCLNCSRYEQAESGCDNLAGHRTNISLDGECFWYSKSEE